MICLQKRGKTIAETYYQQLKKEWLALWDEKFDDEWRAEGIASREYAALFVDKGDVVWATRCFKPLRFYEIVEKHEEESGNKILPADPEIGGWGKFIREQMPRTKRVHKKEAETRIRPRGSGVVKKNGRGWLHQE